MTQIDATAARGKRWRPAAGLAVVCLGTLVAPLDSAVNIALPAITAAFEVGLEDIRWIVIAYVLTYSCLLLIFGKVGDLVGYRRIFQLGLLVSAAGFAACSLAPTFGLLLLGRIVQGIGIALTLSCAPALATTLFDESRRTRTLGVYAAATAIGSALGPLVGGALVDIFGWSAVFWMRAPLAIAALAASGIIPARGVADSRPGFDAAGASLLMAWLVTLLLALALRSEQAGAGVRLVLLGVALAAFAAFVVHERRHPEPIIRPALFRDIEFALMNALSIIVNFAAFAILLLVPYFLVRTMGLGAGTGGGVLALSAVGLVIGSWLAGRTAARVGIGRLALAGVILSIAGLAAIAHWSAGTGIGLVAASLIVQGIGVGLFQVAYTDLVTSILPLKDRGVAGSLTMVTRTIGVVAGASGHSAIQRLYEGAALAAGRSAEEAFVAGFQAAFALAATAVAVGLMLSLVRARVWRRRTA